MSNAALDEILKLAVNRGASDIHLKAGIIPVIRRHGLLRPLSKDAQVLTGEAIEHMALSILDEHQRQILLETGEVDSGYGIKGVGRFRMNVFRQRGTIRLVIRHIPAKVPNFRKLHMPPILEKIVNAERGLILVTGITGSGKSSTIAAMINQINESQNLHIVTIEDPIEFLIRDRKSIISQREVGIDTLGFASALRSALRQDPDVILIGEMRDRETIEIALTAAETGHLVLSTLHTSDAMETINRILAVFDPQQQEQIRLQLAGVLRAVVSQRLARRADKGGFIPAVEIMINNARIKEMIEDPKRTSEIINAIEESQSTWGMQSFDQSLMQLMQSDIITYDEAMNLATNPEDFALRASGVSDGRAWSDNAMAAGAEYLQHDTNSQWAGVPDLELDGDSPDDGDYED